ncbi:hypothetical protein K4K54_009328 [Colletotrichum sp. SAR 10_86]|nr:hypothetical protein K4K54_009328 [Colletotrichum sp. SAR 10_86]
MAPPFPFLALPREIRDAIYEHYVAIPGGYVCDAGRFAANVLERNAASVPKINITGLLKGANDQPINLNLSYTCRLIATEMYGVALRANDITFTTIYCDDLRMLALRTHNMVVNRLETRRKEILYATSYAMPETQHFALLQKYPQFAVLLDALRKQPGADTIQFHLGNIEACEAPSVFATLCKEALRHVQGSRHGHEALDHHCDGVSSVLGMIESPMEHWDIPMDGDLDAMASFWDEGEDIHGLKAALTGRDRVKYRFSAAAMAILFIKSCNERLQMQLRKIVLDEDRTAVACPERHALGLIQFCRQNPLLKIERRVQLWSNALQDEGYSHSMTKYVLRDEWRIQSAQITQSIWKWIQEALALAPAGMPDNSFSLILDGQPLPNLATQMFQAVVQRDIAWQRAWEESLDRGVASLPSVQDFGPWYHLYPGHRFKHLSRAMEDMAQQKSVIQCNFDVGKAWDVENIIQEHKDWTAQQWAEGWPVDYDPASWETESPLSSWRSLLEEDLLPEPEGPYERWTEDPDDEF